MIRRKLLKSLGEKHFRQKEESYQNLPVWTNLACSGNRNKTNTAVGFKWELYTLFYFSKKKFVYFVEHFWKGAKIEIRVGKKTLFWLPRDW